MMFNFRNLFKSSNDEGIVNYQKKYDTFLKYCEKKIESSALSIKNSSIPSRHSKMELELYREMVKILKKD